MARSRVGREGEKRALRDEPEKSRRQVKVCGVRPVSGAKAVYEGRMPLALRGERYFAGRLAGDLDADIEPLGRQQGRHLLRPLNEADAVALEILVDAEVGEVMQMGEAVDVEVVDGQPGV